ncbi:MAG: thiamine diphosphokinase [Lachnospiraceae bacterium]|nr:thiamine diphosphokinase [Lachnospiraceae bacterium]
MSTLIVSGGLVDAAWAREYLGERSFTHTIAVDGGLLAVQALGREPDYIVGDFDTLAPEALECYETRSEVQIRRFNPEKDETDTQIAIELAMEFEQAAAPEMREIVLLGAIGSRMDHTLANLCLLEKCMQAGIPAYAVNANNRISVHRQGFVLQRSCSFGPFLSFVALSQEVTGLTLTGLKYPLDGHVLRQDSSLCISNEFAGEEAEVAFESGILMMIQAKD